MKTYLEFKIEDKPEQMGLKHLIKGKVTGDDLKIFIEERSSILPEAEISKDGKKLTFVKSIDEEGKKVYGTATLKEVEDNYVVE